MWTVEEEAALLNFLYSHLGQVADGNFKKTTWNGTAAHMAQNFPPTGSAGNKTSEECEHNFKMLKKSYYAMSNLKLVAPGFAYNDVDSAMIMLESADLWEWYTKSHKEAKLFCNVRFPHFEGVEVLLPSHAQGCFIYWPHATATSGPTATMSATTAVPPTSISITSPTTPPSFFSTAGMGQRATTQWPISLLDISHTLNAHQDGMPTVNPELIPPSMPSSFGASTSALLLSSSGYGKRKAESIMTTNSRHAKRTHAVSTKVQVKLD
ncbi:hypothetical protein EDC04DRAFT_3005931 [Pisolithus marmoratus]|nr:hypothetical protein EDC04DRAFT_3005931 [Pisolithus marmoratus]